MSVPTIRDALADHVALAERVSEGMVSQIGDLGASVVETLEAGGKLLLCGNGGSAAAAQHLAAEFVVRFVRERQALPAIALTADISVVTASSNDLGFAHVFERQVQALGRPGDLLLLLSTTGASENLVRAAEAARVAGMKTAALLARDGGPLRDLVDLALVVPTDSSARAQEMHMTLGHIVCELADKAFAP